MIKSYYVSAKALTSPLVSKDLCGSTHHAECATNYEWCVAECLEQNKKRGHDMFAVCVDENGHVWIALKDKAPANWQAVGA